jgi:hypothetical protein
MSIEFERDKINRSILILQLAVNLMESTDLNDEDASLLAELVEHSVVQSALSKKAKPAIPVLSDTEIWNAVSEELNQPPYPKDIKSSYVLTEEDMNTRCFQPNGD